MFWFLKAIIEDEDWPRVSRLSLWLVDRLADVLAVLLAFQVILFLLGTL